MARADSIGGAAGSDLVAACTEAFNNAVEHPFETTRASVEVRARRDAGTIVLTIRDYGRWQDIPAKKRRHNGYALMRALVDSVQVSQGVSGTVVTLTRKT